MKDFSVFSHKLNQAVSFTVKGNTLVAGTVGQSNVRWEDSWRNGLSWNDTEWRNGLSWSDREWGNGLKWNDMEWGNGLKWNDRG